MQQTIRFYADANAPVNVAVFDGKGDEVMVSQLIGSVEMTVNERQIQIVGRPSGSGSVRVRRWKVHQISDLIVAEDSVSIHAMPNETIEGFGV